MTHNSYSPSSSDSDSDFSASSSSNSSTRSRSDSESSRGSDSSKRSGRRRKRRSDEEKLIATPRHHRKKTKRKPSHHRHAAAAAPNHTLIIFGLGFLFLLLICGGGWWWYRRQSSSSTISSTSDDGTSSTTSAGASSKTSSAAAADDDGGSTAATGKTSVTTAAGGSSTTAAAGAGTSAGGTAATGTKTGTAAGTTTGTGTATASKTATATTAASTSTSTGSSFSGGGSGNLAAFWENWVGQSVDDTDFSPYTHAYWFAAVPGTADESGALTMGETEDGQAASWVAAAQAAGCKAMLTVGGWSGSNTFTYLVASDDAISAFVDTLSTALDTYGFYGIDIDWEYPGAAGNTNDFDTANDLTNYLAFLIALRAAIGDDKLISADTSSSVWVDATGASSSDISAFADVLDYILIMTYDGTTYSSTITGPNFPYSASCAPSSDTFDIPTAVQAWISAGFPANQIMLGLASYGYAWDVSDFVDGGGASGATSSIYQTVSTSLGDTAGVYDYLAIADLIDTMDYTFDNCTSTPFLYDSSSSLMIAYDDETSVATKGGYAGTNGLFGCGIYAGLTQDTSGVLAAAAKKVC